MGYPALANNNPANMSQDDSVAVQLPSRGRGNSRVAYLNRSIDQLIYDFMEEEKIPGMTLAIVQAPYIPRVVGYGLSDAETGLLASTNTLWPAAEISQAYAAIAAFQLVEQGSMEITDKVSRFVKDLPEAWKNVTVLQLLQHTSGIPDYRKSPQYDAARDYDPAELLSLVRLGDLEFPSGTDVRQSATNFLLLSMVVDAVAGMPYEEFVRQRQFQPLGLNHTMFGKDLGAVEQDNVREHANRHTLFKSREAYVNPAETASGYAVKDGKITPVPAAARSSLRGFADIWSTPEEISFWDVCLAGSILVKDEKHRDMIYKPVRLDNGKIVQAMAGWQFLHHKGLMDIKGGYLLTPQIDTIQKGKSGSPGEIVGSIFYKEANLLGTIRKNTKYGIYGTTQSDKKDKAYRIGYKQSVKKGKAQIISCISGRRETYDIEIKSVDQSNHDVLKGMEIEITDPKLLKLTNGIVQGMSGTPIIQNNHIIGAVTHVFVDDSTKGYATFIENMLNSSK